MRMMVIGILTRMHMPRASPDRLNNCQRTSKSHYTLMFPPEHGPLNPQGNLFMLLSSALHNWTLVFLLMGEKYKEKEAC